MRAAILTSLVLIIGGILACYGLIVAKAPNLKDELDRIIPLQGVIGIILILMGFRDLILIVNLIKLFQTNVLFGIIQLAGTLSKFILGFVLAYGMITKYVLSNKEDAQEKTKKIYNTLILVQVPFGIIAILVGFIALGITLYYSL